MYSSISISTIQSCFSYTRHQGFLKVTFVQNPLPDNPKQIVKDWTVTLSFPIHHGQSIDHMVLHADTVSSKQTHTLIAYIFSYEHLPFYRSTH